PCPTSSGSNRPCRRSPLKPNPDAPRPRAAHPLPWCSFTPVPRIPGSLPSLKGPRSRAALALFHRLHAGQRVADVAALALLRLDAVHVRLDLGDRAREQAGQLGRRHVIAAGGGGDADLAADAVDLRGELRAERGELLGDRAL